MTDAELNPLLACEIRGCPSVFEDRCDECNLSFCLAHVSNHNCGSHQGGSSSSMAASVQQTPSANPPLRTSSASNLFATPPPVNESSGSGAAAKKRKLVQPTIEAAAIRLKWGTEEEVKDAINFKLEVYDGKSWLWEHFKRLSQEDAKNGEQSHEAACNICYEESKTRRDIKWTVYYDKSTTKLSRHLELCHKATCLDRSKESAKILLARGDKTMNAYLCAGADDDHLYRVLKMCVQMCLPISICEHHAFACKCPYSIIYSLSIYSFFSLNHCSLFNDQMSWKDSRRTTKNLIDTS